jgi:arylsulfatase A
LNRRSFLKTALAGTTTFAARATGSKPPNIVLILADDLGWSDTTPYGADLHETPSLERLAREGVRFERAYAAAPICSPTRASILTGKYPARLRMTIWRESARRVISNERLIPPMVEENLPHSEYTLAEALHDAGYFTAHVGKWHLGDPSHYAASQGFDVDIGGSQWGAPETYFFPYKGNKRFPEFRNIPGLHYGEPGEYLTDRLTNEALNAIDNAGDRPFLLNLCFHTPHTPIEGKPHLVEYYMSKLKPGLNHTNPGFAAMVHSMDENVGRVLDYLEQKGLADNTIVLFLSDNGGFIRDNITNNAPLRSGKGALYEGGIRVPLIVKYPKKIAAGKVCKEPVSTIDLYPTLMELIGKSDALARQQPMDGISFAKLLTNPEAVLPREELYFHYPHYYITTSPVGAVVTREWKLLEYFEDGRLELYHLTEDLGESKDLARSAPEQVRTLHQKLRKWRKELNAQMPTKNPDYRPPAP